MEVRAPSYEQEMRFLSGGNQQKAIVARWLALTDGLGLERDYVASARGVLPAEVYAALLAAVAVSIAGSSISGPRAVFTM